MMFWKTLAKKFAKWTLLKNTWLPEDADFAPSASFSIHSHFPDSYPRDYGFEDAEQDTSSDHDEEVGPSHTQYSMQVRTG